VASAIASASSTVAAAARPAPPEPVLAFEPLRDAVRERCDAEKAPDDVLPEGLHRDTTLGIRIRYGWMTSCIGAEVDRVLDLAAARPDRSPRFAAERKDFDAFLAAVPALAELHHWVNLREAARFDGQVRGLPQEGAAQKMLEERLFYAHALAAGEPAPLAARVRALGEAGRKARGILDELQTGARALLPRAKATYDDTRYPYPLHRAPLQAMLAGIAETRALAPKLARSTCAWEPLARALGGRAACQGEAELYYLAHWLEMPMD
jgi:hypothetical protein